MYEFTKGDLLYVQSLIGDMLNVTLRDNNTIMDTQVKTNRYIHGGIINLSPKFRNEIETYFAKMGKVCWNNTGSTWWITEGVK